METAGSWRECRTLPLIPTVSGVPTLHALAAIASCRAGDRNAITTARNLLAALIGSEMFYGNELDLDPGAITWPRTLDMNDRARSTITVSVTGLDKKLRDGSKSLQWISDYSSVGSYGDPCARFKSGGCSVQVHDGVTSIFGFSRTPSTNIQLIAAVARGAISA